MTDSSGHLVEHFFRHESAHLIAVLTRAFGIRRIDLIEDMVQVAMLEAMNAWKQGGVPDNPTAWIHRATKNRILDALRREKTLAQAISLAGPSLDVQEDTVDHWLSEEQLPDSLLRMMFVCCHPTLNRETQIALTLKTLCGFGHAEIAGGLLLPLETIKKRIARAKRSLCESNVAVELPSPDEIAQRRGVVHDVLYLMFNEGHNTSHGSQPIRDDICEEAARLCHLLSESEHGSRATKALLALMLFQAARLESRTDEQGNVILLEDQDRSKWDRRLITIAQHELAGSKIDSPTTYHWEAAIAMQHCIAPSVEATDWSTIVRFYNRLVEIHRSPIYELNRAIARAQAGQINEALKELQTLQQSGAMQTYLLLDCAIARVHELGNHTSQAIDAYLIALSKAKADHEKQLVETKLRKLQQA
ncbi:RNA polymerase sigma factor [Rhodopirellula baltica]|uniref:RNA polymerase, sigma-24 subunit, ECF subfamily n=1 Tax=Rhodopirellula baltica SWK14 TaxID=993516 RepID=L7CD84_RHOBT|nr:sigma-70 family RNA polymerase sigma factor [Rhodopirellula baltica]ELP32179.1 RNA polymerase, sigma-24 subunit, ECF subfamily [Rhodopirellula baltica SWK14]